MSLDQQRAKLEEFASAKGWKLIQVFSDDALSGSDMKRPGLDAMMQFARHSRDIHAVIAWERNRLARPKDPMDGMILERDLLAAGKKVVYVATGQEAGTSFASGLISYVEHHQSGDYLRKLSRARCVAIFIERSGAFGAAGRSPSGMTGLS
jgi:DNA invertase Pin-like site-specific DNA recombinase